ncbi:MAG: hypothetical protein ACRDYZ_07915 [Acidimicrobiales bacterium]
MTVRSVAEIRVEGGGGRFVVLRTNGVIRRGGGSRLTWHQSITVHVVSPNSATSTLAELTVEEAGELREALLDIVARCDPGG